MDGNKTMVEENQTPDPEDNANEETLGDEDKTPPTGKPEGKGTETKAASSEVDYKEKFSQSTREVQRFRDEVIPDLERKLERERMAREKLDEEQREFMRVLESEKPGVKRMLDLERKIKRLEQETLSTKEATEIGEFIRRNPEAAHFKQALKSMGRTNSNMSYDQIWEEVIKPGLESTYQSRDQSTQEARKKQPESGKGSRTVTEKGEIDLKEFAKLPLEKREKILKKRLAKEGREL